MSNCSDIACVGGKCHEDTSKVVSGIRELQQKGCVVYSIGGNDWWQFELGLLESTPCEIHTSDCTGPISRFHKPNSSRIHFHHVCVGTEFQPKRAQCDVTNTPCGEFWTLHQMQQRLGHSRIDLFKMDIEGWEWNLIESWADVYTSSPKADHLVLPM